MGAAGTFGSTMGSISGIQSGLEKRAEGADMKSQMGGAAGIAGGAMGVMGAVTGGVAKIQEGKALKDAGLGAAGRVKQAQAGIDMAASAADMAGPFGQIAGGVLKLVSALMNIQGPRQKRQKRQAEFRRKRDGRHAGMRAAAAGAGMKLAGGIMRTGATIGPEPTVPDPVAPVNTFSPNTTPNGR